MNKKKKKEKEENLQTLNLLNFLYQERMKPIPKRRRPKYETKSGHEYHIINDKRGMFFNQISKMFGFKGKKGYKRIQKRFNELSKRTRMDQERLYLEKEDHYTIISLNGRRDLKSLLKTSKKPRPFIFFKGVEVLLGFMKGKIRDEVYLDWVEDRDREIKELLQKNYVPLPPIELVCFADKGFSKTGEMVASDIEQTTSDILYELGIPHGRCDTIYWSKLKPESQKIMMEYNLRYLDFDFFSKGDPEVIIDVWGIKTREYILKCEAKVKICESEGWRLLIVRKGEDKHPAKLKQRIREFFDNLRELEI